MAIGFAEGPLPVDLHIHPRGRSPSSAGVLQSHLMRVYPGVSRSILALLTASRGKRGKLSGKEGYSCPAGRDCMPVAFDCTFVSGDRARCSGLTTPVVIAFAQHLLLLAFNCSSPCLIIMPLPGATDCRRGSGSKLKMT